MHSRTVLAFVTLASLVACGGGSQPVQPRYQPEIVNAPDSFSFQLTGVQNGDGTLSYTWHNTGTLASVDRSSLITSGSVTLTVRDAANAEVYLQPLRDASGSVDTGPGTAGDWTIVVDFAQATGTINFRAQKK